MKVCPTCDTPVEDSAVFCRNCGTRLNGQPTEPVQIVYEQQVPPKPNPYDKTAEYDAKDIAEHKLCALLVYLMGLVGIVVALLVDKTSPYIQFHVKQGLKLVILEALLALAVSLLFWTVLVPIAGGAAMIMLLVVRCICFVQVCGGKVVEPAVVRSIGFLR